MLIPNGGKFPDEVSWGKVYQRHQAVIHLAAALFAPVRVAEVVSGGSRKGHRRFRAHWEVEGLSRSLYVRKAVSDFAQFLKNCHWRALATTTTTLFFIPRNAHCPIILL